MGAFGEVPLAAEEVEPLVSEADRVLVYSVGFLGNAGLLDVPLRQAGFENTDRTTFDWAVVEIWERSDRSP
jgi:hypothetical protein